MTFDPMATAFLAGLFEGDGYFGAVQFKLGLRDKDIVEYVAQLLKTKIRTILPKDGTNHILYETSLGRKNEREDLYSQVYDWLGDRCQMQIQEAVWSGFFDAPTIIELAQLPEMNEMPPAYTPSPDQWAYLSGYFLAEGSIAFDARSQQAYDRPSLHLSSTDEDVIAYCAKLLVTPYHQVKRPTRKGKKVFVVNVTNFEKLQCTLKNIRPFMSVSARHQQKVEKALQAMQTCIEDRQHSSIQKIIRLNLQQELDTFKPKGAPDVDWEELASIFQEHSFIYFIDVPSVYGILKSVRLRVQSENFQIVEKVSTVFGNKVKTIKRTKKTHAPIYATQLEKKKYVFWILKNVMPFLTGKVQM